VQVLGARQHLDRHGGHPSLHASFFLQEIQPAVVLRALQIDNTRGPAAAASAP
jgi:hypothetical protein